MSEQINNIAEMWWAWMWPMFWQVGVLIVLIAAVEIFIGKRLWPQIRYALWLCVLAKLILPPTFSLSTSVTSGLEPLAQQIVMLETHVDEVSPEFNTNTDLLLPPPASVRDLTATARHAETSAKLVAIPERTLEPSYWQHLPIRRVRPI